mmetsp:Transcript_12375/g.45781  ORF Transcript_12375/g.45781 Transcript_12375/m.45781 type:complete len:145 (-) Transcript_12375:415-849(-)
MGSSLDAHGTLLGLAWLVFAPIALIAALLKRSNWFSSKESQLFYVHVASNCAVVLLTAIGVAVIALGEDDDDDDDEEEEEEEEEDEDNEDNHKSLGAFIAIFILIQVSPLRRQSACALRMLAGRGFNNSFALVALTGVGRFFPT